MQNDLFGIFQIRVEDEILAFEIIVAACQILRIKSYQSIASKLRTLKKESIFRAHTVGRHTQSRLSNRWY